MEVNFCASKSNNNRLSGCRKSTFARILSDKTHLPLYYLDMLWHKPDRTTVERNIFDNKLKEIVLGDKWIIDGNYGRTLEMRIQACKTIFLLDFPVEECLAGAESRIGKQRVDMPWIETEFDDEFRQWIIDFPKNELYRHIQNQSVLSFHIRVLNV